MSSTGVSYVLNSGQNLLTGEYIAAGSLQYFFIMQGDGNVCLYQGSGPSEPHGGPIWASGSNGADGDYFLSLESNGNLVAYSGTPGSSTGTVWSSGTPGDTGSYYLIVQNYQVQIWANGGDWLWLAPSDLDA